jgi:hypothetical protein
MVRLLFASLCLLQARAQWYEDCDYNGPEGRKDVNAENGPSEVYRDVDGAVSTARVMGPKIGRKKGITGTEIGKVIQKLKAEGALDCGRYLVLSQLVQYMREKHSSQGCVNCVFTIDYLNNLGGETEIEIYHKSDKNFGRSDLYQYNVDVKFQALKKKGANGKKEKTMEYLVDIIPENGLAGMLYTGHKYALSVYNSKSSMTLIKKAIGIALTLFFPKLAIAAEVLRNEL